MPPKGNGKKAKAIKRIFPMTDLLLHVKRHLYTPKKTEERQQRNRTPPSKGKHFDQLPGYTSLSASWNPTLYTPMPFVPWQAPIQMPFTLYAPFCNAYQLAQMQQGPMTGFPNAQGQFQQCLMGPSLIGTQSCEGVTSVASHAATQHASMSTAVYPCNETLSVEAVESELSVYVQLVGWLVD